MPFKMYVDPNGVPYSDYGVYRGIEIGRQTSVLSVAERGLWYWNEYLRGDAAPVLLSYDWTRWPKNREFQPAAHSEAEGMFWNCVDWVLLHIVREGSFAVWKYPYPMSYGTKPGWRSSHAQAVGIQLLVRAQDRSGGGKFLKDLELLLASFQVPVRNGGLLDDTDPASPWYEKFADPENRKPKVLNGMLFAIIGLLDIARLTGSTEAEDLGKQGLASAKNLLHRFDLGNWSAYNILGDRASPRYHRIHVEQLALLSLVTKDPELRAWHEKWKAYAPAPRKRGPRIASGHTGA